MLRTIVRKGFDLRYDSGHRFQAARALRILEREADRTLQLRVRRQAEEYAASVLGSRVFSPWLFVYSLIAGEFREGWIPDNYYGRIVSPNINGVFRALSGIKTLTRRFFQSDRIPDAGYIISGRFFDRQLQSISHQNATRALFCDSDEIVIKADGSGQGRGVQTLLRQDFDPAAVAALTPRAVIQTRIAQHQIFDAFVPGGATTLRITTVREQNFTFRARAAYLRVPCGGQKSVQSRSSVRVAVDLASGFLVGPGYLSDWRKVAAHPESGVAFDGFQIPGYADALEICQCLHSMVPQAGCIGWDVILDPESKAWILEWNATHNDIKFSEAVGGPCFRGLGWEDLKPARRTWEL
jgi:hypothetical protein